MKASQKLQIVLPIFFLASLLLAQESAPQFGRLQPLTPAGEHFQQPVWAPDGSMVAVAGKNYSGIWIMRPDGSGLRQVCRDAGAGFRFSWSNDSRRLLARTFRFEKRRRVHVIKTYDVETGVARTIAEFRRALFGLPRWSPDGSRVCVQTRSGVELLDSGNAPEASTEPDPRTIFYNTGVDLRFLDASGEKILAVKPVPGTYLNAALSPDRRKIAFELLGGNLYIVNTDGAGVTDLGPGERPSWHPGSRLLAYMITEDDGHQIRNSDMYIIKSDGTGKQNITSTATRLEMNPCWSPDGQSIVFDEKHSGRIYKITLTEIFE